jgi:hypothetical protein
VRSSTRNTAGKARIAYTYTGDFIKPSASDIDSDMYQAKRKIIDAKVSFRLTPNRLGVRRHH